MARINFVREKPVTPQIKEVQITLTPVEAHNLSALLGSGITNTALDALKLRGLFNELYKEYSTAHLPFNIRTHLSTTDS
jgi:hypothetical protein